MRPPPGMLRLALAGALAALAALAALVAGCGPQAGPRPFHDSATRDELRPTDTSVTQLYRYESTDVVEAFDTDAGFRVHFTRAGKNRVSPADVNDSGVPDFVEAVGSVYGAVAVKYQGELGYRVPLSDGPYANNGGDGRFDVYLLDFGLSADGAFRPDTCLSTNPEQCAGYVVQENDFAGYGYPSATVATRILGSHEYFHAVQDAYDNAQGVVLSEGTAVWATEQFDPTTTDFEDYLGGYLSRTDRSLDSPPPGPVPSFAYGSAVFFRFLSERYGVALVRNLWERLENGQGHPSEPANVANPYWMVQLDALLKANHQSSFGKAFVEFSTWNLYLQGYADASKSYANGASYPLPAMTAVTGPYQSFPLRVFYASTQYYRLAAGARTAMTAALVDDPGSAEDDTQDLALVLAARQGGKVAEVKTLADVKAGTEVLATTGGTELVVAVVNQARSGSGGVLSRRPGLCIGTEREVALCHAAIDPSFDAGVTDAGVSDAGVPDAGVTPEPDAGSPDGGVGPPPPPPGGCGCASAGSLAPAAALLLALRCRRRETPGRG